MPRLTLLVAASLAATAYALAAAAAAARRSRSRRHAKPQAANTRPPNPFLVTPGLDAKRSISPAMSLRSLSAMQAASNEHELGILVHGCHLEADEWESIVWGLPPHQLGRLPHAVLLAWQDRHTITQIVCGTGASQAPDGRLEGQFTVDFLFSNLGRLHEFSVFEAVPLVELEQLLRRTVIAECESKNTVEEVRAALHHFEAAGVGRAVLVSSPTHLPRCLACACRVEEDEPSLFGGSVWASPSDTSYRSYGASDVVVVEPPHRGDRDRELDALPFHEMVRRFYSIPPARKVDFLERFDALLLEYGA